MILFSGNVAGPSFEPAKSNFRILWNNKPSGAVELRHNPDNKYDRNAIEVHIGVEGAKEKLFIGHVPKGPNVTILAAGLSRVEAVLLHLNYYEERPVGARIEIKKVDGGRVIVSD
jgi:hypothetical protein